MEAVRDLISDLRLPRHRPADAGGPTRPLLAALPSLGVALLVLAVGLAASIGWRWVTATACGLIFVAALKAARAASDRGRRRRAADDWLVWGATARPSSALLSWRAAELTSPRVRSTFAHSLRQIQREALGRTRPGPLPLNTRALRRHLRLVHALEERLENAARPVSAQGMVLVNRLLTEPGSPLYASGASAVLLADAVSDALVALERDSTAVAA